jgi:hypothetical protein
VRSHGCLGALLLTGQAAPPPGVVLGDIEVRPFYKETGRLSEDILSRKRDFVFHNTIIGEGDAVEAGDDLLVSVVLSSGKFGKPEDNQKCPEPGGARRARCERQGSRPPGPSVCADVLRGHRDQETLVERRHVRRGGHANGYVCRADQVGSVRHGLRGVGPGAGDPQRPVNAGLSEIPCAVGRLNITPPWP